MVTIDELSAAHMADIAWHQQYRHQKLARHRRRIFCVSGRQNLYDSVAFFCYVCTTLSAWLQEKIGIKPWRARTVSRHPRVYLAHHRFLAPSRVSQLVCAQVRQDQRRLRALRNVAHHRA